MEEVVLEVEDEELVVVMVVVEFTEEVGDEADGLVGDLGFRTFFLFGVSFFFWTFAGNSRECRT